MLQQDTMIIQDRIVEAIKRFIVEWNVPEQNDKMLWPTTIKLSEVEAHS